MCHGTGGVVLTPVKWKGSLTLELASRIFSFACESDFRLLVAQESGDLLVHDVANLIVLVHDLAVCITDASFVFGHEGVARFVRRTDVAVNAFPAVIAVARVTGAHRTILSAGKRAADY
jgi:hypothetical protein